MTGAMTAASLMGAENMYSPELAPFIMDTVHESFEVAIVLAASQLLLSHVCDSNLGSGEKG
jgi:hypothetical protein